MTIWYSLSAFALIFITTGLLYWALVSILYDEDFRDMADNLNNVRTVLNSLPPIESQQQAGVFPPWALPHQSETYLRVLDRNARTLVETPGMASELLPPTKVALDTVPVADGRKQEVISRTGKPFLSLIVRVPQSSPTEPLQFLEVALDREHDQYLLARYRARLWWILGVSLVLSSLIGYLIARSGMRPIERIARTAGHIGSTTLHERIDREGLPAELSGLAETFNTMLDRLQETFQRISQFSDDVAHELRTPINNLRGEIEVALTRARTGDDYREILGSCLEESTVLACTRF